MRAVDELDELHDTAVSNGDALGVRATELAIELRDANSKLISMAGTDESRLRRLRNALMAAGVPEELVAKIEWDAH
jgi:hypothetical protein